MSHQSSFSQHTSKQISLYKNFTTPYRVLSLEDIAAIIRGKEYKEKIQTIRQLFAVGKEEEANTLKKSLPGFTASCRCDGGRDAKKITYYSAYIILDLDHLSAAEIARIKELLRKCPYVIMFFVSVSGNGLKIIVETDGTQENHKQTYTAVADYFENLLGVKIDRSGSEIVRLCFMSHDPGVYFNPDTEVFEVLPPVAPPSKSKSVCRPLPLLGAELPDYIFRKSVRMTNRRRRYCQGNRNNYVFLLGCYCRMNGLSAEDTLERILHHFNFSVREIKASVKSAYRYH